MKRLNPIWIPFIVAFVAGLSVSVWWVYYLKNAHSTFENYYAFRGCVELVEKTDEYGTCKLKNGELIKLVKYDNRWFLDGDLPWNATLAKTPATLPTTCKDEPEGTPVILSLSSRTGKIGNALDITGCNFSGFEGDKNAWIENDKGIKGILYGEKESTSNRLRVILKSPLCQKDTSYSGMECDAFLTLTPGTYKIYTLPFGRKSNTVDFTVTK